MERTSYCRICAAACGIVVTVDDGDVVTRVRGDPTHPVSRGYTCPKGRALPEFHHRPDRLDHPILRGERVGWDDCLDDAASRIRAIVDEDGADAVGVYLGTGLAYDMAGWHTAERLIAGLGTHQRYTPTTIDNAPILLTAELMTGATISPCWDPGRSKLLLLLGSNPVVSHGYGTALADPVTKLRDFRRDGGQIWVVDPRATETAALADRHLQTRAGTDHVLLAWLVRELLAEGADAGELASSTAPEDVARLTDAVAGFTLDRAAAATGVAPEQLVELLSAVRQAGSGLASMAGTGVMMSRSGLATEWLRWVLQIITGSLDRGDGMHFNQGFVFPLEERVWPGRDGARPPGPPSRPELSGWANQYPCVAMADEILSGRLRALVVAGANPLTAFPDPDRTRKALASLDTLVVLDVVHSDLVATATHALPATAQLERADLSMLEGVAFRNGNQYTEAVVSPVAERRPAWWALAQLARRLGVDALGGGRDPDAMDDAGVLGRLAARGRQSFADLVAAGPHGCSSPTQIGWYHERVLPEGRWRLAPPELVERLTSEDIVPPMVLTPRRQVRSMNSTAYGTADPVQVDLNPGDAQAGGLEDGQVVRVMSAHGTVVGRARVNPRTGPGSVSLTHGRADLHASRLTSAVIEVDPLTGMPLMSGVAVSVEPS
ncbi:MAG TPA: molybdopterin-dependent oxidoreductase, partial [Acidimicrobiia bacterium]|nr:molybdopterin-dependent oxidoreductase [Acidimicrobiia bacterium]